ncbi:MAG: BamA/TamA family outer membrane protein [Gemmatimonadota bacterium]
MGRPPALRQARFLPAFLLVIQTLCPRGSAAQECPEGRISYIFIDNRSIFDTSELAPDTRFLWAYRLANSLHMRTRESFLQDELLFETGECLDPLLLSETERLLRAYGFIARSDVYAVAQPDGTQHVIVDTQDEWTTKVDVGFDFEDGLRFTGISLAEENLLGRGMLMRLFFEEDRERQDMGFDFETPRLLDTRWDARISIGRTRTGDFLEESLFYPFVGEVGRLGGRQSFLRRETLFSYVLPSHPEFTHLLLPFVDRRWDLVGGIRLGRPGNLTVLGAGASGESARFRSFPSDVEVVRREDYASTVPATDAQIQEILPHVRERTAHRINFFLGQRNLRFVQRRGLDALKGIQDIQVGTELFLGIGRTLDATGEDGLNLPDDLHTQLSLFAGGAWEEWTINVQGQVEGRQLSPRGGQGRKWKDLFGEADAYVYWQPARQPKHTVLFRLSAAGGWEVETPFQLTLGGSEAVRGYREEDFPGGQRVVFTWENRTYIPWPAPELFDFGLSAFADIGHIQPGGVPFGVESGWRASIGAGIRFGLPPGTGNMTRIDLAMPLGNRTQLKDLVLRVSLREVLGLLPGVRDPQLIRSLRSGVRPSVIALPW